MKPSAVKLKTLCFGMLWSKSFLKKNTLIKYRHLKNVLLKQIDEYYGGGGNIFKPALMFLLLSRFAFIILMTLNTFLLL